MGSFDNEKSFEKYDRKLKQLCREVHRVLTHCELGGVYVMDVSPAPDAARLAIQVQAGPGVDPAQALERLMAMQGALRGEIAAAIQRKRTPILVFQIVPPDVAS